jgi:hypothetical protein
LVVLELYDFVRKLRPRGAMPEVEDDEYEEPVASHKPTGTSRRKNKPMKAVEQEERIQKLAAQLNRFENASGSDQSPNRMHTPVSMASPTANFKPDHAEDSSDQDESESSEEE